MRRGRRGLVVRCYVDSGLERLSIAGKAGDRGVALRYAGILFVQKPVPFRDNGLNRSGITRTVCEFGADLDDPCVERRYSLPACYQFHRFFIDGTSQRGNLLLKSSTSQFRSLVVDGQACPVHECRVGQLEKTAQARLVADRLVQSSEFAKVGVQFICRGIRGPRDCHVAG